jgi:hypothetical protein
LIAFPTETVIACLGAHSRAFIVLGDGTKCTAADSAQPHGRSSPFERLFSVWENLKLFPDHYPEDPKLLVDHYDQFSGGRRAVFEALADIETEFQGRLIRARFKALLRVRERFTDGRDEIVILYPVYLERLPSSE